MKRFCKAFNDTASSILRKGETEDGIDTTRSANLTKPSSSKYLCDRAQSELTGRLKWTLLHCSTDVTSLLWIVLQPVVSSAQVDIRFAVQMVVCSNCL